MKAFSRELIRDFVTYGVGYVLAISLTLAAFATIHYRLLPPHPAFLAIICLAFVQVLVHLRCFLHVSLKRSSRADLQLVLFSTLVVLLMVAGTLIIIMNLRVRMMYSG